MAENPLAAGSEETAAAAETEAAKPKRRTTRKKETPAPEPEATAAEKKRASYHILEAINVKELSDDFDGEVFVDLGQFEGQNADKAVDAYLDENQDVEDGTFIPVPKRHFKRQEVGQEPQPPKRTRKRA